MLNMAIFFAEFQAKTIENERDLLYLHSNYEIHDGKSNKHSVISLEQILSGVRRKNG